MLQHLTHSRVDAERYTLRPIGKRTAQLGLSQAGNTPSVRAAGDTRAVELGPAVRALHVALGMAALRAMRWSPYVTGAAIGALSTFAFATANRGLGITTAFEHTAALVDAPAAYLTEHAPKIDWEWMLVVGVFIGSFISSKLSRDRSHASVPPVWRQRFGGSVALRMALAFVGGLVMMFGARLARGCTSGHGITGTLQLAVSSWTFIAIAFAVAITTALALYGRPRSLGGA